jgi:two-component system, LytTR family, sensor kinase
MAAIAEAIPAAIPRGSAARILVLGVGLAVVLAISFSTQTYLAMIDHGHAYWKILIWQLAGWLYWALVAPWIVLRLCAGQGGVSLPVRHFARVAAAGVPVVAAHIAVIAAFTVVLQPYVPVRAYTFGEAFGTFMEPHLFADVLLYAGLAVAGRMFAVGEHARGLAMREAQLETDVARARLEALRLEIQPHFLFNTLNSIAALIRIRANDQALEMLLGLGELMRATIDRTPSQVTPWPIELAFTKGYIELQQVRFGDRLDVVYVIDPAAEACLVPAFLLQPIVENAFRHGVGAKAGRCRLELGAAVIGGRLRVTVRDDGAGIRPGFDLGRDAGTGLSNIRTRLQNLYGGPASLAVTAAPGGGTIVTLDLPPEPPADLARASA